MPIILTPEQERRVTTYAKQKQKPVERVIDELLVGLPALADEPEDRTLELLDAWAEEDATDDPAELLERAKALAAFKANMNANRAATGEEPIYR